MQTNQNLKIALYVPTFNRAKYVSKMAKSLEQVIGFNDLDIYIFDDASDEFGTDFLKTLLPNAKIHKNIQNMRADKNLALMYLHFLQSDCDVFVNVDSDLIFAPEFFEKIKQLLPKTSGVMSLYNSNKHPFISTVPDLELDYELGIKEHIGSAGSILDRKILSQIVFCICNKNKNLISPEDLTKFQNRGGGAPL